MGRRLGDWRLGDWRLEDWRLGDYRGIPRGGAELGFGVGPGVPISLQRDVFWPFRFFIFAIPCLGLCDCFIWAAMSIRTLCLWLASLSLVPGQGEEEERIASLVGELWKSGTHLWDGGEGSEDFLAVLAEEVEMRALAAPGDRESLAGGFLVSTLSGGERNISGKEAVTKYFTSWPQLWCDGEIERAKFKVVGVTIDDGTVETESLVSAVSQDHEYNGRWKSRWQIVGKDLVLKEIVVGKGRVVKLKGGPLFRDLTLSLLPADCETDPDLIRGNYEWRQRIPGVFEPDQFGETGISVADVDGDGLEDVYLCQIGGLRNRLWLQQKKGSFVEAASSGLDILDNTTAALFLDLDGDRDRDAVLATAAGVVFFENKGKSGFRMRQRLADARYGFGMAASDFDRDGDLDLYVCQYHHDSRSGRETRGTFPQPVPVHDAKNGGRNLLLRNQGDWVFDDATAELGLEKGNFRLSFASLWEDFDNDGDQDLFVVNDFGPNNYYRNEDGKSFSDCSSFPGVKDGGFGMGLTAADFDRDGYIDLHISNMYSGAGNRIARQDWFHAGKGDELRDSLLQLARGNTLLRNLGGRDFEDRSRESGIAMGRWSWASLAVDLNNDSFEDLLVANGFVTGKEPDDL